MQSPAPVAKQWQTGGEQAVASEKNQAADEGE